MCPHCLGENIAGPHGPTNNNYYCHECEWQWIGGAMFRLHYITVDDPDEPTQVHTRPDLDDYCLDAITGEPIIYE